MSSLIALTLVAVLQTAAPEAAADSATGQEAPDSTVIADASADSIAPAGQPAVEPLIDRTPSELVAHRIREALGEPHDAASWQRLADALPGLAQAGGETDPDLTRAGLLADSIATAILEGDLGGSAATGPAGSATDATTPSRAAASVADETTNEGAAHRFEALTGGLEAVRGWWAPLGRRLGHWSGSAVRGVPRVLTRIDAIPTEARLGFGGLALWLAAFAVALSGRRRRARHRAVTASDPGTGSALWAVRHLAATGVPLCEIARKTGMAQDAVTFILSPAARNGLAGAPAGQPPSGEGPVPLLLSDPGRSGGESGRAFRDGRVTYAPPGQPAPGREEGLT
jgi:hypothetical protein